MEKTIRAGLQQEEESRMLSVMLSRNNKQGSGHESGIQGEAKTRERSLGV